MARTAIPIGSNCPPDHARYYPFYAKCVELDIPIQLQVGQSHVYDPRYPRRSVGRPITLDSVACDFPELKLVGIHVGIPWTDEMIAMAWKHPNVYIGTDAHSPKYWPPAFVQYINSYGQDKVIFGTDFPILRFERTIREIEELGLKPQVLPKLFAGNVRRLYRLGRTRMMNLADALAQHARARPTHAALVAGDRTLTYRELHAAVDRDAAALVSLGAREGDLVGLALKDTIEHVTLFYALARLGLVILPMDWRWTDEEKSRIAKHFAPRYVVVEPGQPIDGASIVWSPTTPGAPASLRRRRSKTIRAAAICRCSCRCRRAPRGDPRGRASRIISSFAGS